MLSQHNAISKWPSTVGASVDRYVPFVKPCIVWMLCLWMYWSSFEGVGGWLSGVLCCVGFRRLFGRGLIEVRLIAFNALRGHRGSWWRRRSLLDDKSFYLWRRRDIYIYVSTPGSGAELSGWEFVGVTFFVVNLLFGCTHGWFGRNRLIVARPRVFDGCNRLKGFGVRTDGFWSGGAREGECCSREVVVEAVRGNWLLLHTQSSIVAARV